MAFDRTNPDDLLALKNEVTLDPTGMGYDLNGNTDALVALLNDPVSNVGNQTGNDYLTVNRLLKSLMGISISSQDQFKIQLAFEISSGPESDISDIRSELIALNTGIAGAIATITRPLSRAEVLFGAEDANGVYESVTISRADWIAARDS